MKTAICYFYRSVQCSFGLIVALLVTTLFSAAVVPVAHGQSNWHENPFLVELAQRKASLLKPFLPELLSGMKRDTVVVSPLFVGAGYSGGEPLIKIRIVLRYIEEPADREELKSRISSADKLIKKNLNGWYLFLTEFAAAQNAFGEVDEARLSALVGGVFVGIKGKVTGETTPEPEDVRKQLLSIFEAFDAEQMANARIPTTGSGRFKVSGEVNATGSVTDIDFPLSLSTSNLKNKWSFELENLPQNMSVRIHYLPTDIQPGTYKLHEEAAVIGDSVEIGSRIVANFLLLKTSSRPDIIYWDENIDGTLTIESIKNGKISGHLKFKANSDELSDYENNQQITVTGHFEQLEIMDGK